MDKIQVGEKHKEDYISLIQAAQNVEATIGSAYCKLSKMTEIRKQIDADLKLWWDTVVDELKLDKSKDYYVDQDGTINVVDTNKGAQDGGASEVSEKEGVQSKGEEGQEKKDIPVGKEEDTKEIDNKEGQGIESLV